MKPYPAKAGDTKRELRKILRQGTAQAGVSEPLDLTDATAVTLRIKGPSAVLERAMTKGTEIGEVFYRWTTADFAALPEGKYEFEIKVTFPDGSGTAPTEGKYWLRVENTLS